MNDGRFVAGFLVGALAVGLWLGLTIRGNNADIHSLEATVSEARDDLEDVRAALEAEEERLNLFKEFIAEDAQQDMLRNVTSAAVIGAAAASNCLPGYTNPRCDNWYEDSYARTWAWRAIQRFTLAREVRQYGRNLVRRTTETVEETIHFGEGSA